MMKNPKMIMREKRILCGEYLEVEIYPVFESDRNQSRAKKCKTSLPKQRNLNDKNAKKHLTRLINTNFGKNDIHLTLTYSENHLPETSKQAENDITNYIRRVNTKRKRLGLSNLRYVCVTEQQNEDGKLARLHHHIICDGDLPRDMIDELWGKGRCNSARLQPDESGLAGLAHYITKETKRGKRWRQSRGLKQPVIFVNDWKWSKRKVQKIAQQLSAREIEKGFEGWHCSQVWNSFNDLLGLFSITALMRRLE